MSRGDTSGVFTSHGPDDTQALGEALGRILVRRGPAGVVVALSGPLGSGKTCFVQGLARGLGASGYVRSPTFTLIHEYPGPVVLYHVDLYRLARVDVETLGLEEMLDGHGVTAIEWGEQAEAVLPPEYLRMDLAFGDGENDRDLVLRPHGDRYRTIAEDLRACASSA